MKQVMPWLSRDGKELHTDELRKVCVNWDSDTWERYLKWYETPLREKQIEPVIFDRLGEELTKSIFAVTDPETPEEECQKLQSSKEMGEYDENLSKDRAKIFSGIERHLGKLRRKDEKVLRLYYLGGLTDAQIGIKLKMPRSTIHEKRHRALSKIRRGLQGENPAFFPIYERDSFYIYTKKRLHHKKRGRNE